MATRRACATGPNGENYNEAGRKAAKEEIGSTNIKWKDFTKHLKGINYKFDRKGAGSHQIWKNSEDGHEISIHDGLADGTFGGVLDRVYGMDGEGQS